jgi:hypothetical protein
MTETPKEQRRGFLIMPFDPKFDWLHEAVITASAHEGVQTRRADDIFARGQILRQILEDIDQADVIFAVCTDRNANVFFELGYAWLKHNPILIAENAHDLPFDVAAFRTELYGSDVANADRQTLPFRLRRAIKAVLDADTIPHGRRLADPPQPRQTARLHARFSRSGKSHKLTVSNPGTVDIEGVDVIVPEGAESFHLNRDGLPIEILRSGESVDLHVFLTMGRGPRVFDINLHGNLPDGENVEFPAKISL